MKLIWIIFLAIVSILLIAGAYIGYTVYQGTQLIKSFDQEQLETDIKAIEEKDCSKLPNIQERFKKTKENLISACKNPALKKIIEKQQGDEIDICEEVQKSDNELKRQLDELEEYCSNQSS